MRQLSELLPGRTDRAVFVGQTGSGKTTLAEFICASRPYVVALDTKGTMRWSGYQLVRRLRDLPRHGVARVIYRPIYAEAQDDDVIDGFFEWIFRRKRTTLYIDELAQITRGDQYPFHLGACFAQGRELGVEVFSSTQRPTRIPQIVLSESEHVYTFRLRLPQDRDRIFQTTGLHPARIAALPKRDFFYVPQDGDAEGPYRLQLS